MFNFFDGMDPMLQTYWYIALPASLIFIIQSVLTFIGLDHSGDTDGGFDMHTDTQTDIDTPFHLFTFRNLINFLLGFGWGGISFYHLIDHTILLIGISVLFGIFFIGVFFIIIKQIQKLAENNTFQLQKTVNHIAQVYITIPANRSGTGKIQISVNGAIHEVDALTESDKIVTGASVRVVKVESGNLVVVEKI